MEWPIAYACGDMALLYRYMPILNEIPKFVLGKIVMSIGICEAIDDDPELMGEIDEAFNSFVITDWGEISHEDVVINHDFLSCGGNLLGEYTTSEGTIYITRHSGEKLTTIMFSDEYSRRCGDERKS